MYVPKSEANQTTSLPESDLDTTHYEVVQSNWSREYNDVNVPYALGKGFYAGVEKKNADALNGNVLVRLPKAEGTTTGADLKVVHFDPSMMQGEPEKVSSSLRTATAKNPVLRLTAERDAYRSTALLTRQDDATNSYEADKDAVILLDTELEEIPQVYTIAGTRAVGVNVARRIDQVPLGVYAGEGKGEVTLTIEGIGDWAETLYLYDAVTRKSTELSDNTYTLRLDGSSHGRYFLSAGSPTGNEGVGDAESISVYSAVSGRVVASASEALKRIQVFTPMGRLVRTLYPARPTYTFDLPGGIYIIRAEIAHDQKTVKLRVQ